MSTLKFLFPVAITTEHILNEFESGQEAIDVWLRERANKNQKNSVSRTYVVGTTSDPSRVVAFYSLHAGSIEAQRVTAAFRQNSPNPIPVIVVGRLAVDLAYQRHGLGKSLLQDAVRRANLAGEIIGAKAILVQAKDEAAAEFYRYYGFKVLPGDGLVLVLPTELVERQI